MIEISEWLAFWACWVADILIERARPEFYAWIEKLRSLTAWLAWTRCILESFLSQRELASMITCSMRQGKACTVCLRSFSDLRSFSVFVQCYYRTKGCCVMMSFHVGRCTSKCLLRTHSRHCCMHWNGNVMSMFLLLLVALQAVAYTE
jgi:hypothetical protein